MKKVLIGFLLVFIPVAVKDVRATQEETLSVKAEVDKAFLTIGDRVEYRVTITHSPSLQILSQIAPPPSDTFETKEVHDFSEKQGKEIVEGRRFILTLYELGEYILEPVTIRYRMAQGEEKSVETNRLYLTVQSVDASGKPKTDIRTVKGVLNLPRRWGGVGGVLLFFLTLGGGLYAWWRARHRPLETEKFKESTLSPEDEALVRLSRLFDSDFLRRGKFKEYFLELSEILRRYFERRFEIKAVESTTTEILRDLRQKELSESLLGKIQQVMEAADLAKFAKWKPTPVEILRINQMAKALVEEARPKPAPVSTDPTAPPISHGI